jgi:diaminopimelate epimerase
MLINFFKYQGTGNDFIIIDFREKNIKLTDEIIKSICNRKFGIGSDGLMIIKNHDDYDFEMKFFNPDGSSSFCGNGSRCAVLYSLHHGFIQRKCSFLTNDGVHQATVNKDEIVRVSIRNPQQFNELKNDSFEINTGSPHYIQFMSDINQLDFLTYCKSIRNNKKYKKNGININLVEDKNSNLIMRTFERGVENETLSCGSGVTAAALAFGYRKKNINKVHIKTLGGNLIVEFKMNKSTFSEIHLSGPSSFVFKGELNI